MLTFIVQGYSDSSVGNASEWRMYGRDLVHSSTDGVLFDKLDYINQRILDLSYEPLTSSVVANGFVYTADGDGNLYQFNATDIGQTISSISTGSSFVSPPIVVGDYVYIGGQDGVLLKLDARNVSKVIYVFETESTLITSAVLANDYVYIGTDNGFIFQINSFNLDEVVSSVDLAASVSNFAIAGDFLYVGTSDGVVYQINASDLSQIIASYLTGAEIYSAPAVYNGSVYIGSGDGFIYQLDAENISNLISSFDTGYAIYASPTIFNDFVYIGNIGGTLYQLSAANLSNDIFSVETNGGMYATATIYDGNIYFGSYNGIIYKANVEDITQIIATYDSGKSIRFMPVVANNYIYFGTDEGFIYQLNAEDFNRPNQDVFPPQITLTDYTDENVTLGKSDIRINASITDESNLINITVGVYDSFMNIVSFTVFLDCPVYLILYGLQNGVYFFEVNACDAGENCESTNLRRVNIDVAEPTDANTWRMFKKYPARIGTDNYLFDQIVGLNQEYYYLNGPVQSSPAVSGGFVYVGSSDGYVYQLDAANVSVEVSKFETAAIVASSPAVSGGFVYVGSDDGYLYQLDAADVSVEIARFATDAEVSSSPAVVAGYIYVGSLDGYVYQLSAANISQKISDFYTGSSVLSSPAVVGNYVYIGSNSNSIYQLNASNINQLIAEFVTDGWVASSPAVVDGYVYVGSQDGYLYQLDASDISVLIEKTYIGSNIDSSPAVVDGYVYIGSNDGYVYQFDASNISIMIAKYNSGGDVSSSPAVTGGFVYVGSAEGRVHQLNSHNISILISNFTTGAPIHSSPAVAGSYVYIGSSNGLIYQLNRTNILFENYDAVPPFIRYELPTVANDAILGVSEILVNVSAEDYFSGLANITVFIYNNSGYPINYLVSENEYAYINFSFLEDGQYYFNATACDFNNNCNKTETRRVFVDRTAPLVYMDYTLIGANISNSEIFVNLSVFDLALFNLSVYLYDANGNLVNLENTDNDAFGFNFSNLTDGEYSVVIEACDSSGNCNSTQYNNITIDTVEPTMIVNLSSDTQDSTYDANGTLISESSSLFINLTANDSYLSNTSVYLYDENHNLVEMQFSPSTLAFFNFANLRDGTYYLRASACDYSGNCQIVTIKVIIDTSSSNPVTLIQVDNFQPASASSGSGGRVIEKQGAVESCDAWSMCINGKQTRNCTIAGTESKACEIVDLAIISSSDTEVNTSGQVVKKSKGILARLFDVNLGLLNKQVQKNKNLTVVVSLINLGVPGKVNATLYYEIENANKEIKYTETEVVPVETQEEFIKTMDVSTLENGAYTLFIDLKYEGQKEPAQAKTEFTVYTNKTLGVLVLEHIILVVIVILLIVGIVSFFLLRPRIKEIMTPKPLEIDVANAEDIDTTPTINPILAKNSVPGAKKAKHVTTKHAAAKHTTGKHAPAKHAAAKHSAGKHKRH
jgi:outer membrane protein assembly factor BamB